MGGFAPAAIERAGRIADGFIGSSSGTAGVEGFKQARDLTLKGLAKSERDAGDFSYYLHVPVFVGSFDEVADDYQYLRWKYADMREKRASSHAVSPPPVNEQTAAELRTSIIFGSPSEIASQINEFKQKLGDDIHFICRNYFAGMAYEKQLEQIRLIGTQVSPLVNA